MVERIGALFLKCFNEPDKCINVIGGGKMATALVRGFIKAGCFEKSNVFICTRTEATADQWKQLGFPNAYKSSEFYNEVKKPLGVILIAVKPQMFENFLAEVRANQWFNGGNASLFCVSIMAGISLRKFDEQLRSNSVGFKGHTARLMPNINCAVSAGTLVFSTNPEIPNEFVELLQILGSSVGTCLRVDESQFNAASAISGCGPAFIAIAIEAVADGGVLSGLSRELATKLTVETFKGTAQYLSGAQNTSAGIAPSAAQLKDQVCSPSGTTITGLRELERQGFRSALIEAVHASTKRANEFSQ